MKKVLKLAIDKRVRTHFWCYIFQCALATGTILLLLLSLNIVSQTAIIATLGATAFIIFALPQQYVSRPWPVVGGYGIGVIIGGLCRFVSFSYQFSPIIFDQRMVAIICGAIAVGITMLLMVVTNTEHPPAAGIALGLVLNTWDYMTIVFILAAVVIMVLVKRALKSKLIDLV